MTTGEDFFRSEVADYVSLNGVRLTAPATLTSAPSREYNWDEQGGAGLAGAWLRFTGNKLARFTLQFAMWSPEGVELFDRISNPSSAESLFKIKYTRSKDGRITGVNPLAMLFPPVNQLGVFDVVVASRGAIVHAGAGKYTCDVGFIEYHPPPPIRVSKVADPKLAGKENIPPQTEKQKQIAELLIVKNQKEAAEARVE